MIRFFLRPCLVAMMALAATLSSSASCGSPAPPSSSQSFVGAVSDTDAVVGLVVLDGKAFLFFCGGKTTLSSLTHWIHGTIVQGTPFTMTDGVATATGTLDGTHVSGTLETSGGESPHAWSADIAVSGTLSGVYTKQIANQGLADLVVSQASATSAISAQGAFRTLSSAIFQVTPLHPIAQTGKGIAVSLPLDGKTEEEFLIPAAAE
jgi:hypothetical protein